MKAGARLTLLNLKKYAMYMKLIVWNADIVAKN